MSLRINTNESSLLAQRYLGMNARSQDHVLHQMSSGHRIVSASDDAAGMAISETLEAGLRSYQQADRNTNDSISIVQTAEGGLSEVSNIIIRLRELAVQASSDTLGDSERSFANQEFQSLKEEINRIARSTEFNGYSLLNGDKDLEFQVGINNRADTDRIIFERERVSTGLEKLQLDNTQVATKEGAQQGLDRLSEALNDVSSKRSLLGATQNRLLSTSNNLKLIAENVSAAKSRIKDLDYAEATADNTRLKILTASGTSVLSQANTSPMAMIKLIE